MRDIKVASRYAKSLLKIAIEENSLEDLNNDMVLVNDVCINNKELTLLLQSPIIKSDKKTAIMNEIFVENKDNGHELRKKTEFCVPRVNTVYKGDDSLRHLGPLVWKIIPVSLKQCPSLIRFKTEIKKWVPSDCPCRLCKDYIQGVGYVNLC